MWAHKLSRWKNVAFMIFLYQLARRCPNFVKAGLIRKVREQLGPGHDVSTHFNPRYNPWEHGVPRAGWGSFPGDQIGPRQRSLPMRLPGSAKRRQLKSGREVEADIVVTPRVWYCGLRRSSALGRRAQRQSGRDVVIQV
jgi:cation diffusion facilitator CzcD-associated flavoprotein CzcO